MGFLESLFTGVRAFVKEVVTAVAEVVHVILDEIDRSQFGRATTRLIDGASKKYFGTASDLAAEERELAAKYERDGRRSSRDEDRLQEIRVERESLKKEIDSLKSQQAVKEFRDNAESVISAGLTTDETSASVGIIASKTCPECGGLMRIRQGGQQDSGRRTFYWQCTDHPGVCPTVKFDPEKEGRSVLRQADPNLDLPVAERRRIWEDKDVLQQTASRLRQGLGEDDKEIICPHHLLPMKLLPIPGADGRLLVTYHYVCLGVDSEGRACNYRVPLETFPQVSEALRRREGQGIIQQ